MISEDLDEWNEGLIEELIKVEYEEDEKIDYKERLELRGQDRKVYKTKIEALLTSFANSRGGFVIFGITDDREVRGINLSDDEEGNLKVSQIVSNTKPFIHFKAKRLAIDSKVLLIVKVDECLDKPVQTSNGSFHMRIGGQTVPIPREQLQDWFISKELKKQRYEQLMFEINWMKKIFEEEKNLGSSPALPPFYKLRLTEFQKAISDYYAYFKSEAKIHINEINKTIAEIEKIRRFLDMEMSISLTKRWGHSWTDLNGFLNYSKNNFLNTNQRLYSLLSELKSQIVKLEEFVY